MQPLRFARTERKGGVREYEFNGRHGTMCLRSRTRILAVGSTPARTIGTSSRALGPAYRLAATRCGSRRRPNWRKTSSSCSSPRSGRTASDPRHRGISLSSCQKMSTRWRLTASKKRCALDGLNHKLGWRGTKTHCSFREGQNPVRAEPAPRYWWATARSLRCMFTDERGAIGIGWRDVDGMAGTTRRWTTRGTSARKARRSEGKDARGAGAHHRARPT